MIRNTHMGWLCFLYPIICFHFLLSHFPSCCSSLAPLCNSEHSSALLQFKNSLSLNSSASEECVGFQSSYPKTASWKNGTNCCLWDGVTCDTTWGHVIGLDLSCSWLLGKIHPNSTLFQLAHLQRLNLAHNSFIGSPIYAEFGGFMSLTHLNLSESVFGGEIPPKISELSKLISLDLSWNLCDLEPLTWNRVVQNLTHLQDLFLDGVNMSLIGPKSLSLLTNISSSLVSLSFEETELQGYLENSILCLPNLQKLRLSRNRNLGGKLPESNWSTHLRYLDFSRANFSGDIPSSLINLQHLTYLELAYNSFGGQIPNVVNKHSKLQTLDLSGINLGGQLLDSIGYLKSLNYLYLSSCKIEGPIPNMISELSNLTKLDLSYNSLNGTIPSWLFSSPSLLLLDLRDNQLIGHGGELSNQIPIVVSQRSKLQTLFLSGNNLGQLPDSIGYLKSLNYLYLSSCKIEGPIPNMISELSNLTKLDLSYNSLNGTIPSWLFSSPSLLLLDLRDNQLTGHGGELSNQIPIVVSQRSKLQILFLSGNNLGQLPDSIGYLKSLNYLDLSSCKLEGSIPNMISELSNLTDLVLSDNLLNGTIPSWLFSSSSLLLLDLSDNQLTGHAGELLNQIPNVVSQRSKLQNLFLSGNNLGGQLPNSIGYLKSLNYLDLSSCKLEGSIPNMISELSNLTELDLSGNLLNGTIPSWLFSSPSLLVLDLSDNQLTGHVGELSSYSLKRLYLSYNLLQGCIPKSIFDFENLTDLDLSSNNLSGVVDFHQFSNLKYLESIDLSRNNFLTLNFDNNVKYTFPNLRYVYLSFCKIHSFPKFLRRLQNLEVLDISNNKIHGKIPRWFNNVGNNSLNYLNLSGNLITSIEYLSLRTIHTLDLSSNLLQGDLPILPSGIRFFSISNNQLVGYISSTICNAKSLVVLNLSHNNLTGRIPHCLASIPYLSVLDLKVNKLSGSMLGNFSEGNVLQALDVNGNQLEGPLPQSLVNCKYLEILDLGNNNINYVFPHWLQTLSELQVLILRGNKFHGAISTNFKTKHPFPKLRIFDISNNSFRGTLPASYIKEFKGMVNIDGGTTGLKYMEAENISSSYVYSVVITMKGNVIDMSRILTIFTAIDFSNNEFEGEIPEVVGELQSLKGLNLSHNMINGSIPKSFGKLINLEWLDLSWNRLGEEIPMTLTNLNSLAILNLSHNQLVGSIPQGKQFNTFMNDSYGGNLDLCGFPLSKTCKEDEEPPSSSAFSHTEESGFTWKAVVQGYGCGMVFGIFIGCIVFSIKKPQWLVRMVEGEAPKRSVKRARNGTQTNRRRIN